MAEQQLRLGLQAQGLRFEEQYALRELHPLRAGGTADFFVEAATLIELVGAVNAALKAGVPYIVLGSGAHVLFSDGGFPGLVVRNLSGSIMRMPERSQVVADSGVSLDRLVTTLAGFELGGLIQFYGDGGSLGGALYRNLAAARPLNVYVRHLTVMMPPAKASDEAKIVRQPASWLMGQGDRLRSSREGRPFGDPQPVLLTAVLQLTHNRGDELSSELRRQAAAVHRSSPSRLFQADPETLARLQACDAARIRVGRLRLDRRRPCNLAGGSGPVSASQLRQFIETVQARVVESSGASLPPRFEYVGVW